MSVSVARGLLNVKDRVVRAALAAGRDPDQVKLMAVSKLQPASAIREAYAAGQRDFGENYVQELVSKAEELSDLHDLRWHLIGHLQRNKARKIAGIASSVHTVDSIELAEELGKRAAALAAQPTADAGAGESRLDLLVEVSIAGEAQKSGVALADLPSLLDAVEAQPALRLRGLMCVPPLTEDPQDSRPYFDQLRELREAHGGPARLPELSMGMTLDLEHAIAAGATWIRVGTAIFGERPAKVS